MPLKNLSMGNKTCLCEHSERKHVNGHQFCYFIDKDKKEVCFCEEFIDSGR